MKHEEIVARLHARHREHLGWTEAELPVAGCAWCAMYAEWVAPLLVEVDRLREQLAEWERWCDEADCDGPGDR